MIKWLFLSNFVFSPQISKDQYVVMKYIKTLISEDFYQEYEEVCNGKYCWVLSGYRRKGYNLPRHDAEDKRVAIDIK